MKKICRKAIYSVSIVTLISLSTAEVLAGKTGKILTFLEEVTGFTTHMKHRPSTLHSLQKSNPLLAERQIPENTRKKELKSLKSLSCKGFDSNQFKEFQKTNTFPITMSLSKIQKTPIFSNSIRFFSTSMNHSEVDEEINNNSTQLVSTVPVPVPEILSDDDLESCYVIGRNYCHKTVSFLNKDLGNYGRKIVTDIGFLFKNSEKVKHLDSLNISLNRQLMEDFDDSESLWKNKLQTLEKDGFLKEDANSFLLSVTEKGQEEIKISVEDKLNIATYTKNVNMAIKNINTMLSIRNEVLSRRSIESE